MKSHPIRSRIPKSAIVGCALVLFATGCTSSEALPPEISVDISPVNVGVWSTDAAPLHFDLQLRNTGEEALVIQQVIIRGDTRCSFAFQGPDKEQISGKEASFIRGWYDPDSVGEDHLAIEVTSNATNYTTFVIPLCGKGVSPGTTDAEAAECAIPPADQGDCQDNYQLFPAS